MKGIPTASNPLDVIPQQVSRRSEWHGLLAVITVDIEETLRCALVGSIPDHWLDATRHSAIASTALTAGTSDQSLMFTLRDSIDVTTHRAWRQAENSLILRPDVSTANGIDAVVHAARDIAVERHIPLFITQLFCYRRSDGRCKIIVDIHKDPSVSSFRVCRQQLCRENIVAAGKPLRWICLIP